MCRFKIVTVLKQVMRPVEKIERVFELKLVASYIIAASVSWWIKQSDSYCDNKVKASTTKGLK